MITKNGLFKYNNSDQEINSDNGI